jgi:hypothetical protein
VVDLGHNLPGLEDRIARFAADVRPLLVTTMAWSRPSADDQ